MTWFKENIESTLKLIGELIVSGNFSKLSQIFQNNYKFAYETLKKEGINEQNWCAINDSVTKLKNDIINAILNVNYQDDLKKIAILSTFINNKSNSISLLLNTNQHLNKENNIVLKDEFKKKLYEFNNEYNLLNIEYEKEKNQYTGDNILDTKKYINKLNIRINNLNLLNNTIAEEIDNNLEKNLKKMIEKFVKELKNIKEEIQDLSQRIDTYLENLNKIKEEISNQNPTCQTTFDNIHPTEQQQQQQEQQQQQQEK